jgi:Uma2 family endonuclease
MATVTPKVRRLRLGPESAGMLLTRKEFDRARGEKGWRYELINGVLIVSPTPSRQERAPNEQLGYWLRQYKEGHPQGSSLDETLPEEEIPSRKNRRRVDRAIWAGLGRLPEEGEIPTIVVEFVSQGKINQDRDYIAKKAEYREAGVKSYWVVDRFRRCLTVYTFGGEKDEERIIPEGQKYAPTLLPGFELDVARLLYFADLWARKRAKRRKPDPPGASA